MKNNLLVIITTILIIVGMILGIQLLMFNDYRNDQYIEITVTDKYIKRKNNTDIYMIVDENKNTYKITDLFFKFKFDSTDIYNDLEIGKTYKVKTSGYRMKFLSDYPNINEIIEEIKEKEVKTKESEG